MKETVLKNRWDDLWKRIDANGNADEVYEDLERRYSETHRKYHTLTHIQQCLNELEEVRGFVEDPNTLELAIWYHDVVYDPKARNSEEQSGAYAKQVLEKMSFPDDFIKKMSDLILATKHKSVPTDSDAQLMVDIDLSILGQTEDVFDTYEQQIREEYKNMEDDSLMIRLRRGGQKF